MEGPARPGPAGSERAAQASANPSHRQRERYERCTGANGSERAVDVQINRLRRKIEADPSNPVFLQTVRGKGYILHAE